MSKDELMKQDDYCYACVAVSSTGQEHICGFSKTFGGLGTVKGWVCSDFEEDQRSTRSCITTLENIPLNYRRNSDEK